MIHAENVNFSYHTDESVLKAVCLKEEAGHCIALLGNNGVGKSTFLKCFNRILRPDSGTVLVENLNISKASRKEIALTLAYVEQHTSSGRLTVYDTVLLGRKPHMKMTPSEEDYAVVDNAIERLHLTDLKLRYTDELSGGELQKVMLARALAQQPKVLLLDEPLGALDLKLRQDMQYELIRLKNELGITFLYVTHDQEEALTMSDTIVVMNQGYIQQIGTPEKIYNEPENAFVADFIGESNIISATMVQDRLVKILGVNFPCVDEGFGQNKPVDVVIRPEDIDLLKPGQGSIDGVVTHMIFKGVHYEMEVMANNYEWLVHSTDMFPVGTEVSIHVDPFDIQIMKKPESEDEEAVNIEE